MSAQRIKISSWWMNVSPRFLPFADAATLELPLSRLLRLALFQVSVGMAIVLLNGTLNRVMIVELGVSASLVALMIALPVVFAPIRALVGFRSDQHRSFLGWRRVPYIWFGSLLQFGGLAIMPFALLILSGDTHGPAWIGQAGAALAFLLVGAGLHTTQTAGLALATDLAPDTARPRVVALLYVLLLVGTLVSAFVFGYLLENFSQLRLIQVVQGAAVATMILNALALWQQEPRQPSLTRHDRVRIGFADAWRSLAEDRDLLRLLTAVGMGAFAFSMQDVLLEPFAAQVLGLAVGDTTRLTGLLAGGSLLAFGLAAARLQRGGNVYRLAAAGLLIGVLAFSMIIFSAPLRSNALFAAGTVFVGFGTGLFTLGTLIAAMALADSSRRGFTLGAWGAMQASAMGLGVAAGGMLRDLVALLAAKGFFGDVLADPATGYSVVYHIEILFLFSTLVAIGPLVGRRGGYSHSADIGLAELPG